MKKGFFFMIEYRVYLMEHRRRARRCIVYLQEDRDPTPLCLVSFRAMVRDDFGLSPLKGLGYNIRAEGPIGEKKHYVIREYIMCENIENNHDNVIEVADDSEEAICLAYEAAVKCESFFGWDFVDETGRDPKRSASVRVAEHKARRLERQKESELEAVSP